MIKKDKLSLRPFEQPQDYLQGVQLQKDTWGEDFTECVPVSLLQVTQKIGGVVAGAFDVDDKLVGFVLGISGMRDGRPAHWSHMLAVRPEYRGSGLGRNLKEYQRDLLLSEGIEIVYWTYDPLVSGNAHLNINRLGAVAVEYVQDMYGEHTKSDLHSGLGTDRFIVEWRLNHQRVKDALTGDAEQSDIGADLTPVNIDSPTNVLPVDHVVTDDPLVRIEIPYDIQQVKDSKPDVAQRWRNTTRRAFQDYLQQGYTVVGFSRGPGPNRCGYLLGQAKQNKTNG